MFRKEPIKAFLLIFIPYAVILSAGFALFVAIQYNHNIKLIKKNELLQLDLVRKSVERELENILPDIEVLANERHIQQFFNQRDEASRKLVEQEITSFSKNKRIYRQIRLLDINGQETARVDNINNNVTIIDKDRLQNKSDRYYFKKSISLGRGELYMSPLDLNVENNVIETPYSPTIRFAMPVYDDNEIMLGIIVLNYRAIKLLEHFDEMLAGSYGHIALLNQDGYWLRSHKPEREWAFMFNRTITFDQKHPDAWQAISTLQQGQIESDEGLFTFASVYPLALIGGYSEHEEKKTHLSHHHSDPHSYVWKIISDVSSSRLQKILNDQFIGLPGIIWLSLILFGSFISWYLSLVYLDRRALRSQIELHAKIYKTSTEGIVITDANQKIIDINDAYSEITGYSGGELIGNKPNMLSSGRHDNEFYSAMWDTLKTKGYWEGEIQNRHKNGSIYTEWIRISSITNPEGIISNYIALVSDITHRKAAEEELIKHAHQDPLTGTHNRLSFEDRFDHDLLLAKRNNKLMALLYLDLNNFKPINDTYGHQTGDIILQNTTQRILNNIRETDTLARLGGDEFVIILSQIENEIDAEKVANTLRYIIHEPSMINDNEISVEVSIGIALYPKDGHDKSQLITAADEAMFNDKQSKKST